MLLIKALTGGLLAFLPLQLVVRPKKTMIPGSGQPTTVYVASIEYPGGIEELQKKALEMGAESAKLISNMHEIETETRRIVAPVDNEKEEYETATEFFPDSIELAPDQPDQPDQDISAKEPSATSTTSVTKKTMDAAQEAINAQKIIDEENNAKIEKAKKLKKAKAAKEKAEAKKAGSEAVKTPDKEESGQKEDDLLGVATKFVSEERKPVEQEKVVEVVPEKISRDQIKEILKLKNNLQINNSEAWFKLVNNMKFPDVTKANDMTAEQGDKFIKYLEEELEDDIPF